MCARSGIICTKFSLHLHLHRAQNYGNTLINKLITHTFWLLPCCCHQSKSRQKSRTIENSNNSKSNQIRWYLTLHTHTRTFKAKLMLVCPCSPIFGFIFTIRLFKAAIFFLVFDSIGHMEPVAVSCIHSQWRRNGISAHLQKMIPHPGHTSLLGPVCWPPVVHWAPNRHLFCPRKTFDLRAKTLTVKLMERRGIITHSFNKTACE